MTTAMKPTDLSSLGRIFAEPSAYADPVAWHAAAKRLREDAPIIKVSLPDYPEFYAVTRHADVMEIERNPEIFTNAPVPALATLADRQEGGDAAAIQKRIDGPNSSIRGVEYHRAATAQRVDRRHATAREVEYVGHSIQERVDIGNALACGVINGRPAIAEWVHRPDLLACRIIYRCRSIQ